MTLDIFFILSILILDLYLLFHVYKLNNSECECSHNSKLNIIKCYLIFSIICSLTQLYIYKINKKLFYKYKNVVLMILIPLSIIYAYITYLYTIELKNKNCNCVNTLYVTILYLVSLLISFISSFFGLIVLGFFVLLALKRKS